MSRSDVLLLARVLNPVLRLPIEPPVDAGVRTLHSFPPASALLTFKKIKFWSALLATIGFAVALTVLLDGLMYWSYTIAIIIADASGFPEFVQVEYALTLLTFAIAIPAYMALILRFAMTWYILTEDAVRIRGGVWILHDRTVSYSNIQNVSIHQGPVQRLLGISNLVIEYASSHKFSFSGAVIAEFSEKASRGIVIQGVTDPIELRDLILRRSRPALTATSELALNLASRTETQLTSLHVRVLREIRLDLGALTTSIGAAREGQP